MFRVQKTASICCILFMNTCAKILGSRELCLPDWVSFFRCFTRTWRTNWQRTKQTFTTSYEVLIWVNYTLSENMNRVCVINKIRQTSILNKNGSCHTCQMQRQQNIRKDWYTISWQHSMKQTIDKLSIH